MRKWKFSQKKSFARVTRPGFKPRPRDSLCLGHALFSTRVHTRTHTYTHTHTYTWTHTIHTQTYTHVHTYTHMLIYTLAHMQTHSHTRIHTLQKEELLLAPSDWPAAALLPLPSLRKSSVLVTWWQWQQQFLSFPGVRGEGKADHPGNGRAPRMEISYPWKEVVRLPRRHSFIGSTGVMAGNFVPQSPDASISVWPPIAPMKKLSVQNNYNDRGCGRLSWRTKDAS